VVTGISPISALDNPVRNRRKPVLDQTLLRSDFRRKVAVTADTGTPTSEGIMPKPLRIVRERTTPLTDLVTDYLANCRARGVSEATLAGNYAFALQRILLPWCNANGINRLEDLDERALTRFAVELMTNGGRRGQQLSKHSVRTYIRPVRFMLTWAEKQGEDVQAKPEIPRVGKRIRDVLSRDEIAQIESAANSERDKLIIRLFADCGLRLNELAQLRRRDIRRTDNHAMLHIHGKGDRDRRVPVPPGLMRRLQRHADTKRDAVGDDYIFIAKRRSPFGEFEALKGSGIEQMVRWTARRAGIERGVHPHLFRHSWMTEMLRRGMNPIQLSVIAGASQPVIAQYYEHLNQDDAYDAMLRAWSKDGTH
jgi:integrase/recombinase XerD